MLHINHFISKYVTERTKSMFLDDINHHSQQLRAEIFGKKVLVIGGAGSIGSSYIKALLPFEPTQLVVVDLNENGLAVLTLDLQSTNGIYILKEY